MSRLHDDELPIDLHLVRALVDQAVPELAHDDLAPLGDTGSSNALFRLGRDKLVRLPRQTGGGATIDKEAAWLPRIAAAVSIDVPHVIAVGEPALLYPERWMITTWLPGDRPATPAVSDTTGLAHDLSLFLGELRRMPCPTLAIQDPAPSWYRGLPLADLDDDFRESVDECRVLGVDLDLDEALEVWQEAIDASRAPEPTEPTWYHGDLLGENLLLDDNGRLASVIDFGGLALGNPTVDLAVAWDVLDPTGRDVLRSLLDVDDATWLTSRGWALLLAVITFPYYGTTMPARCSARLAMANAALLGH